MHARKPESSIDCELTEVQIAAAIALGAVPALAQTAEPEVLDEAFLEYLAEFDDEKDDWSWFDRDDKATDTQKAARPESRHGTTPAKVEKP